MGSSIRVEIKDPEVSYVIVQAIADEAEHIDRCPISHEILSGGNRFVFIQYSTEAAHAGGAGYVRAIARALSDLEETPKDSTILEPLTDCGTYRLPIRVDWTQAETSNC